MSDGKPLENAIRRAASEYARQGKCGLKKQEIRTSNIGGYAQYTGTAPIDFFGCFAGGRFLFVECKSTEGASLPVADDHFGEHQVAEGNFWYGLGAEGWLVVEFARYDECYGVPWLHVKEFFEAPWRRSLSLQWVRSYGLLLPSTGGNKAQSWKVWFLDGKVHEGHEAAFLAVQQEKVRAAGCLVSLDEPEGEPPVTRGPEQLTMEERMARIRQATEEGLLNAAKQAKRPKWRARRKA